MNKFKLPSSSLDPQPRKTDPSQQHRREQVHLLSVLDRCTQILRDDRIWLRNRVKQMDPEILAVFRKSLKRVTTGRVTDGELQALQVSLRKFVNRTKERHKQEQLTRFKENLCGGGGSCMCDQKHKPQGQPHQPFQGNRMNLTSGSTSSNLWRREDEMEQSSTHQESEQPHSNYPDNTFSSLFKNKKKNLLETLKMQQPIEEESETEKQLSSYRSRSQQPQNRKGYHREEDGEKWIKQSGSAKKQDSVNVPAYTAGYTPPKADNGHKSWSMYNKQPVERDSVEYEGKNLTYQYNHFSDEKKNNLNSLGTYKFTNESQKKQTTIADGSKDTDVFSKLASTLTKEELRQSVPLPPVNYPDPSCPLPPVGSYNFELPMSSSSSSFQALSGSNYFASSGSSQKPTPFSSQKYLDFNKVPPVNFSQNHTPAFSTPSYDFKFTDYTAKPNFSKQEDDNLFTSPELLMECRKILEKSAEKKTTSYERQSVGVEGYAHIPTPMQSHNNIAAGLPSTISALSALGPIGTTAGPSSYAGVSSYGGYSFTSNTATAYSKAMTTVTASTGSGALVSNYTVKQTSIETIQQPFEVRSQSKSPYKFPAITVEPPKQTTVTFEQTCTKKSTVLESVPQSKLEESKANSSRKPAEKTNPLSTLAVAESFERESELQQQSHALVSVGQLSPQEIFDAFFFSEHPGRSVPPTTVPSKEYYRVVSENFQEFDKFEKIFEMCENSGSISALDFGRTLDKVLSEGKGGQADPIREIFGLIDIKQKGFFNLEDYQKFLEQVLESEQDNYDQMARLAYRLFELADVAKTKKVQYWGLYLTKQTEEFQNFSEYLGQFEFEVEI